MSLKNKIESIIEKHKNGICFLLGIRTSELEVSDIKIMANFLTYKAGDCHLDDKGEADKSFLDAIKKLPPEKKCEKVLFEACAWKESGELRAKSLTEALKTPPLFSPRVERGLEKMRIKIYHREFKSLAIKTADLAKQMRKVEELLKSTRSFEDPNFRNEMKKETQRLGHIFSGANYHLKGAMLYAVKSGYSPEQAGNAINKVYLSKVKKIFSSLKAVDDVLILNGIKSSLSKKAVIEYDKWSSIIEDCTQLKGNEQNEKHNAI